jgi:hypothetical protein
MRRVRDATAAILDETTLEMVCNQVDAAKHELL